MFFFLLLLLTLRSAVQDFVAHLPPLFNHPRLGFGRLLHIRRYSR